MHHSQSCTTHNHACTHAQRKSLNHLEVESELIQPQALLEFHQKPLRHPVQRHTLPHRPHHAPPSSPPPISTIPHTSTLSSHCNISISFPSPPLSPNYTPSCTQASSPPLCTAFNTHPCPCFVVATACTASLRLRHSTRLSTSHLPHGWSRGAMKPFPPALTHNHPMPLPPLPLPRPLPLPLHLHLHITHTSPFPPCLHNSSRLCLPITSSTLPMPCCYPPHPPPPVPSPAALLCALPTHLLLSALHTFHMLLLVLVRTLPALPSPITTDPAFALLASAASNPHALCMPVLLSALRASRLFVRALPLLPRH
ncbi:unnamed protein product [Closterium sp. NIES-54]